MLRKTLEKLVEYCCVQEDAYHKIRDTGSPSLLEVRSMLVLDDVFVTEPTIGIVKFDFVSRKELGSDA